MKKLLILLGLLGVFANLQAQNLQGYYVTAYSKLEAKRAFVIDLDTFYATTQLSGLDTILATKEYVKSRVSNLTYDSNWDGVDSIAPSKNTVYDKINSMDTDIATKVPKVTSTDNAIARFNGTTGDIQNSGVTIDDSNNATGFGTVGIANATLSTHAVALGQLPTLTSIVDNGGINLTQNYIPKASDANTLTNSILLDRGIGVEANGSLYINRLKRFQFTEKFNGGGRAYIGSDATNMMNFAVGGEVEAMRITAGGNVGIGTTTPGELLQVKGNIKILTEAAGTNKGFLLGRTATEGTWAVAAGANQYAAGTVAGDIILRTEATSQALILNSGGGAATLVVKNGNVGIGTTAPGAKLQVTDVNKTGALTYNAAIMTSDAMGIDIGGRLALGGRYSTTDTANTPFGIIVGRKENATDSIGSGYLGFWTTDTVSPYSHERMRITSTGNVGIGTTTPSTTLDVNGNARFRSIGTGTATNFAGFTVDGTLTTNVTIDTTDITGLLDFVENHSIASYTETDPVWSAAATNYYTKTNLQTSGQSLVHWDNITNEPTFQTGTESYISNLSLSGNTLTATGIGSAFGSTVGNIANTTSSNVFTGFNQTLEQVAPELILKSTTDNSAFISFKNSIGNQDAGISYYYSTGDFGMSSNGSLYFAVDDGIAATYLSTGQLQLNKYTGTTFDGTITKYLGVDASGNVVKGTISTGVTDHSALSNLSYATSGHTDFVSTNTNQTISAVKTFSANPEITGTNSQLTIDGTSSAILGFQINNTLNGGFYYQSDGRLDTYAGGTSYIRLFSDLKLEAKSAGENAVAGMMYYDSDDNTFRGYNGSSWIDLGATGSGTTDLSFSGTDPVTLASSTGQDVTFTAGSNITLTRTSATNLTIAASSGATGDNISVDGSAVTDPNFINTGQVGFVYTTGSPNTIAANINDNSILEADLKAVNSPTDEYVLTYEATTGDFEWQPDATGSGGSLTDGDKGDITVSGGGATWTIDNATVGYQKLSMYSGDTPTTWDIIQYNGSGMIWSPISSGLTNTYIQYGNASSSGLSGEADFTYNSSTNILDADNVTVNTEVYGAGWDADLSVPTKDAVYDKIETIAAGSSKWTQASGYVYLTSTTDAVRVGASTSPGNNQMNVTASDTNSGIYAYSASASDIIAGGGEISIAETSSWSTPPNSFGTLLALSNTSGRQTLAYAQENTTYLNEPIHISNNFNGTIEDTLSANDTHDAQWYTNVTYSDVSASVSITLNTLKRGTKGTIYINHTTTAAYTITLYGNTDGSGNDITSKTPNGLGQIVLTTSGNGYSDIIRWEYLATSSGGVLIATHDTIH